MDAVSWSLVLGAAGVGVIHTVLGADHYVPFLMMARARGWSASRTLAVAAACGAGHVASSLLLGGVGLALGAGAARLGAAEAARADLAAWALAAFGVAYAAWGTRIAIRRGRGLHPHAHGGRVHVHAGGGSAHRHEAAPEGFGAAFWALFTILVLGPCEPLVPIFILPAGRGRWDLALTAAAVFAVFTIGCMAALALAGHAGLRRLPLGPLERWSHALAGCVVAASGIAVAALGI